MYVTVDQSKCQGHGQCYAIAPDVFSLDDDGYVAIDGQLEIPAGMEEGARKGVRVCPEAALTLHEG